MKRLIALLLSVLATFALAGCAPEPRPEPAPDSQAVIYEVNVRQFSEEGSFKKVQEHLPRLKALGVDILWLMPIHPISQVNKKGELGSPYSVADYYGVNPEFGTEQDLKNLISAAQDQGFRVILDWVANHTGWDNPWISEHPEWYTQPGGEIIHPAGTDWTDVADLNYDNPELRRAMIDAMKYWVEEYDIDGFRADVAHSVPVDFWNQAAAELQEIKDLFMLAEDGGDQALLKTAFDTNYAWGMKDLFNRLGKNSADAGDFRRLARSIGYEYKSGKYQMVFITNHDENSWSGSEFERLGENVKNLAAIYFTVPGMPLIYNGQEVGLQRSLKFFEKDPIVWPEKESWGQSEWEQFYTKLVALRNQNPALWVGPQAGGLNPLHLENNDVVAYSRSGKHADGSPNHVLVIANLSDEPVEQTLELGDLAGDYTNWFTQQTQSFSSVASVSLDAHSFLVFTR